MTPQLHPSRRQRRLGATACALTALLVLSSCSGSSKDAGSSKATTTTTVPAAPSKAFAKTLAGAGIEIVPDGEMPPSFGFTEWQASNLETAGGLSGAQIDTLAPMTDGTPPLSAFIVGWVTMGDSPQAKAAKPLLQGQSLRQPPNVVFPQSVIALFVHDAFADRLPAVDDNSAPGARQPPVTEPDGPGSAAAGARNGDAAPAETQDDLTSAPCTTVAETVKSSLDSLFNAIKLDPKFDPNGTAGEQIVSFLKSLFNAAVDAARYVVNGLISVFSEAAIQVITQGISALAVATEVMSYVRGWDTDITRSMGDGSLKTGRKPDHGETGSLTFTATGLEEKWPPWLRDCAKKTNVPTPTAMSKGAPTTWTFTDNEGSFLEDEGGNAFVPAAERKVTVGAKGSATLSVQAAGQEPKIFDSKRIHPVPAVAAVTVAADSAALAELRKFAIGQVNALKALVVAPLQSSPAAEAANAAISTVADKVNALITDTNAGKALLGLTASTITQVAYHDPGNDAITGTYDWSAQRDGGHADCYGRSGTLEVTVTGDDPNREATLAFSTLSGAPFVTAISDRNEINFSYSPQSGVTSMVGAAFLVSDAGVTIDGWSGFASNKADCSFVWSGTKRPLPPSEN